MIFKNLWQSCHIVTITMENHSDFCQWKWAYRSTWRSNGKCALTSIFEEFLRTSPRWSWESKVSIFEICFVFVLLFLYSLRLSVSSEVLQERFLNSFSDWPRLVKAPVSQWGTLGTCKTFFFKLKVTMVGVNSFKDNVFFHRKFLFPDLVNKIAVVCIEAKGMDVASESI